MEPNAPFRGDPTIQETSAQRDRSMRSPRHDFAFARRPMRLVPLVCAPVMAGDTLRAASLQMRAVTDPLIPGLSGWYLETYWFYHRIMDMADGASILASIIDETAAPAISDAAAVADLYYGGSGINWVQRSLPLICQHYFRDYGEAWDSVMQDNLPVVALKDMWWRNYTLDSAMPADDIDAEDFENLWSKWQILSRNRMTTATYEEFLRQQGVVPPANLREPDADLRIPELIRHTRDWTYPVATINPSSGVASNAVSWVVNERFDRARRFTEPGFILGFAVVKPKAYLSSTTAAGAIGQAGYAAAHLRTAKSWVPPVYSDEPGESLSTWAGGTGPAKQGTAAQYWIDWRDLYLEGDQMLIGVSDQSIVPVIPRRGAGLWSYPTEAGLEALFVGTPSAPALVRAEGTIQLRIAGRVRRTTA